MAKRVSLQGIKATLVGLQAPHGPMIDTILIDAENVDIDTKPFALQFRDEAPIEAKIGRESLTDFLNEEQPGGLTDFDLEMRHGLISLAARSTKIIPIPIKAKARLKLVKDSEIHVELEDVQVLGGNPQALVEGLLKKMNPIFQTSDIPLPMKMSSVDVQEGEILVRGTVSPQ